MSRGSLRTAPPAAEETTSDARTGGWIVRGTTRARNASAWASTIAWGFLITVLTWPFASVVPIGGLDPSWRAALNMAAHRGLDFGHDVVWTYGPLGFLKVPFLYYVNEYRLAILYSFSLRVATAAVLLWAIRRTFSLLPALAITWIVLALLTEDPAIVLATVTALSLLAVPRERPLPLWVAGALGAWAGLEVLGKLSIGGLVFLVLLIALAAERVDRRRRVGVFVGSFVISLAALWLVSGQGLGSIGGYLRYSFSVGSGYSAAMGTEDPTRIWNYWAALAVAAILGWGVVSTVSERPGPRRMTAALLIIALVVFAEFKEGFVRHDTPHVLLFFSAMLCIVPALGWGVERRGHALLATGLAAVALLGALGEDPAGIVNPRGSPSKLWDQAKLMVSAGERNAAIAQARTTMARGYAIDPALLELVGNRSVHVLPYVEDVAWAYRLNWRPFPVFQDYQAYTGALDDLNAGRAAGVQGPERILRNNDPSIDGRLSTFDPPREHVELLCHFQQASAAGNWQVLSRVANRCGGASDLGAERKAAWGEQIAIPPAAPGTAVVASVSGLDVGGLEHIRALALRPVDRYAVLDGKSRVRIIPAVAGDGLLLSVPPAADYPPPFTLAPNARTISFVKGKGAQPSGHPLRVRFKAIPITGSGAAN